MAVTIIAMILPIALIFLWHFISSGESYAKKIKREIIGTTHIVKGEVIQMTKDHFNNFKTTRYTSCYVENLGAYKNGKA